MKCSINGSVCQKDWLAQNGSCDRGPYDECKIAMFAAQSAEIERLKEATAKIEEHIFREAYNTSCLVAIMSFAKDKTDNEYALLIAEKIRKHLTKEEYERQKASVLSDHNIPSEI